ncbi:hypothetical protein [Rhizobium leguminosarum]|uniref:hypothetical protein n=1 Tax=Rhizobium leguminosarum TaxID=384 RepID=UPI000312AB6C|nr:hypothetical protein [Rhizobium leguminosarum]
MRDPAKAGKRLFAHLPALHLSHVMSGCGMSGSCYPQFDEINDDTNERHCHVIDFLFPAVEADPPLCLICRKPRTADECVGG